MFLESAKDAWYFFQNLPNNSRLFFRYTKITTQGKLLPFDIDFYYFKNLPGSHCELDRTRYQSKRNCFEYHFYSPLFPDYLILTFYKTIVV